MIQLQYQSGCIHTRCFFHRDSLLKNFPIIFGVYVSTAIKPSLFFEILFISRTGVSTCLRVYTSYSEIISGLDMILQQYQPGCIHIRYTLVLATPNRTKESCIKIIYIIYQNSSTTIFLIIATKVFVNLPITFNTKLPYLARGNEGVVYLPTVRLNLLYIECLQIHVSPSRKPVIFHFHFHQPGEGGTQQQGRHFPVIYFAASDN